MRAGGVVAVTAVAVGFLLGSLFADSRDCDSERVDALRRGLAYAEGVQATVQGLNDPQRLHRADRNVQATRDALGRCGVGS